MKDKICNLSAEQSILGSLILDASSINEITELGIDDFYFEQHKKIFSAMLSINEQKLPIDIIVLSEELKERGYLEEIGGVNYISSLVNSIPMTSNLKYYVDIVKELSTKRNIILKAYDLIENIRSGKDIDSSMGIFENNTRLNEQKDTNKTLGAIMTTLFDKLNDKPEEKIKTGIDVIDKHTNGFDKKELITIAAGSGVGKSSMALLIAIHAYRNNKKVLIISREMSKEQIAERIIQTETGIGKIQFETRNFNASDWERIVQKMSEFSTDQIIIDDESNTISKIKKEIRLNKPDLLIIDYTQLITPEDTKDSRERQVATISREFKNITLDFGIPVIQLSQLSDKGHDYRPHGETYIRESRSLYHDSNIVIYVHHVTNEKELAKVYKTTVFKERGTYEAMVATLDSMSTRGIRLVEIIVDKNRNGSVGSDFKFFNGADLNYYPIA